MPWVGDGRDVYDGACWYCEEGAPGRVRGTPLEINYGSKDKAKKCSRCEEEY